MQTVRYNDEATIHDTLNLNHMLYGNERLLQDVTTYELYRARNMMMKRYLY